jgi:hypothetical protein
MFPSLLSADSWSPWSLLLRKHTIVLTESAELVSVKRKPDISVYQESRALLLIARAKRECPEGGSMAG